MSNPTSDRWLLPDGVDELLPETAWRIECARRQIMDHCHRSGYDLVMPPMIEYLDSLLTGTGETMSLQTFKLVDQHNGRTLGIRADMTPQVARLDAHALRSDLPNRFFYTGSVLRARTDGFGGSRAPLQFGAELFGHAGPESDIEIVRLMLDTLAEAGIPANETLLDLGHVGVYRAMVEALDLTEVEESELFEGLSRGSVPDVSRWAEQQKMAAKDSVQLQLFTELMSLRGDENTLANAKGALANAAAAVTDAIVNLEALLAAVRQTHPDVRINIDLAELRGYQYHTGVLFAAYTHGGVELARGGRYDAVGAAFGRARPATGFSGDLKALVNVQAATEDKDKGIFVEAGLIEAAWNEIQRLRATGERVVVALPDIDQNAKQARCDRELIHTDSQWQVRYVNNN